MKRNTNFYLEPQEVCLFLTASESYKKVVERHLGSHSKSNPNDDWDDSYESDRWARCEELGRLAGLAFRAAEKLYPWPGASITEEIRKTATKHGLKLSYAVLNRGIQDDGMEGWPYNYCYFREEPSPEALKAFGGLKTACASRMECSEPKMGFFAMTARLTMNVGLNFSTIFGGNRFTYHHELWYY